MDRQPGKIIVPNVDYTSNYHLLDSYYSIIPYEEQKRRIKFALQFGLNVTQLKDLPQHGIAIWTAQYKRYVQHSIDEAYSKLYRFNPHMCPKTWRILLTKQGMDWNLPYTVPGCIVLNKSQLDSKINLVEIIIHEAVHLMQRRHPKIFDQMYASWGFLKLTKPVIFDDVHLDHWITNPDALHKQWVIILNQRLFVPLMIKHKSPKKRFIQILVPITLRSDGYHAEKHYILQSKVPSYTSRFPVGSHQIDHPNEISAHYLAHQVMCLFK